MTILRFASCLAVVLGTAAAVESAHARDRTTKSVCLQAAAYKSVDELRKELLIQAKRHAVEELFGQLIASSTDVQNFQVVADRIKASSLGFVRIDGDPLYANGQSFGEACVTIKAFATESDFKQFVLIPIKRKLCLTDANLTTRALRDQARERTGLQALIDYNQALKDRPPNDVKGLLREVQILEEGFVPDTETFCVTIAAKVRPIEVTALVDAVNAPSNTKKDNQKADVVAALPKRPLQWVGTYTCGQGLSGLTFTVIEKTKTQASGVFHFYPVPSNPTAGTGCFILKGVLDEERGTFEFAAHDSNWIANPSGYSAVGMIGSYSKATGEVAGSIALSGCRQFKLVLSEHRGQGPSVCIKSPVVEQ